MSRVLKIGADNSRDAKNYQIELQRKLEHALQHIDISQILLGLTASRLVATNAIGDLASVSNLANWIAGTTNQITVTDDGDGTITLSTPNVQITTYTDTSSTTAAKQGMIICNKATAMTLNLPTITGNLGLKYGICNIGAGTVTIEPNGAETIMGDTNFDLYQDESLTIFASATEWREGGI
jgi:hypothetical protein